LFREKNKGEGRQIVNRLTVSLELTQGKNAVHGLADEVDLILKVEVERLCL
jgi:hypothetical protein